MKIEIPSGYRTEEIAYTAGVLVDDLVRTEIPGTEIWPKVKDTWIDHIRGVRPLDVFDLTAYGIRVGYRGYLDNFDMMKLLGITLILDEPRILVKVDENKLSSEHLIGVENVLRNVTSRYDLEDQLPPNTLIFPKQIYAKEIVVFDSSELGFH